MHAITVHHTIDAGHRVVGHLALDGAPGKCAQLHGHTYTFDIELVADSLDPTGFVVDFGRVKAILDEWDHRTLLWDQDRLAVFDDSRHGDPHEGVIRVPFNPTAEHMASYLAWRFIAAFDINVARVIVRETAKTSAMFIANSLDAETAIVPHWPVSDEKPLPDRSPLLTGQPTPKG